MDAYVNLWRKLLGIRTKRHITKKEVIIEDPDYAAVAHHLEAITKAAHDYYASLPRSNVFGYVRYIAWFYISRHEDKEANDLNEKLEAIIEVLSNSKDRHILNALNAYPVMDTHSFRFYRRRRKDLRAIIKNSDKLKDYIYGNIVSVQ